MSNEEEVVFCDTCLHRVGGHGFIPARCEHSGAIQQRHTERATATDCPFYATVTVITEMEPEYGRVLDGSPTFVALQLAWQRLHFLLHQAEGFPDDQRHETAIALDAVTRAMRDAEGRCEDCDGPLVPVCRDVVELVLDGHTHCSDFPDDERDCSECNACEGKGKPN